jgi:hypothetical protein
MSAQEATARLAGIFYLLLIITGIFSLMYVPSQLVVTSDPALNLAQIIAGRDLFALGMLICFICFTLYLVLAVVLYPALARHGETWARLMVLFVAVSVPISFLALAEQMQVLDLVDTHAASPELADQIVGHIRGYYDLMHIASIFWGLWLFPFGLLAWRARMLPRVLALALMLGAVGFLVEFAAPIFFDGFRGSLIATIVGAPSSIGEIGACLWLLFGPMKNLRPEPVVETRDV